MPSTTTDETRETSERARGASTRAQRQLAELEDTSRDATDQLVAAWTELARLFVPPAALRPEEALRVLLTAVEQAIALQRRTAEELLAAGRDVVVGTDLARNGQLDGRAA